MTIDIIDPLAHPNWDELMLRCDGHTFFHSSLWARTLHEAYGFAPRYFTILRKGAVQAVVPMMEIRSFLSGCRGVSLPFSDFCSFIGDRTELNGVVGAVLDHGRKRGWKYAEFRSDHPLLQERRSYRCHFIHDIDLTVGEDQLFRNLRDSTKRNIKKAVKEGVSVTSSSSRESLEQFCRLNSITRRQHGIPPQPALFFDRFHENVFKNGVGRAYLALHGGNCIAGAIYVRFGNHVVYKYGASEGAFQHLRANNLLMWEAIRDYAREGAALFSFGRTEPENEGLRQFKNGWGGREETVRYHRFNLHRNLFEEDPGSHGAGYTKILSRLPIPVLETIGKYLYRHVG